MATYTEATRASEVILSEAPGTLSREMVTIASGAGVIPVGMVLGRVTGSGHYVPYDDDFTTGDPLLPDGREVARCVALETVDATGATKSCAVLMRLGEVKLDLLAWHEDNDAGDITAGLADLAGSYLIAR